MSLQLPISPSIQRRLDERRASRELINKVSRFIWLALRRRGVPYRERPDLVQTILLAALEAWPRYNAELASPQKWLHGIIHHQVLRWRASCAKHPFSEEADADQEFRDEAPTAEELLMSEEMRKLAHMLYQEIPFKYLDAMLAHELEGMTIEEIALAHGIPVSTAHYHVQEGKRRLRAAFARWQAKQRERGVLVLPLTVKALLDADRTIPPAPAHVEELAWQLVQRTLSGRALDADMDAQGHGDGLNPEEDADGTAPPQVSEGPPPPPVAPAAAVEPPVHLPPEATSRTPLGPVGVALVIGLIVGAWLHSVFYASRDPIAREEAPIVSAAPPVTSVAILPAPSSMASAAPPEPPTTAAPSAGTASANTADFTAEQTAFDIARAAFVQGNMMAALQALEQHAQRYPRGPNAFRRDRMWIEVLISVGRTAEACRRVESFRRAYPKAEDIERFGEFCSMRR